MANTKVIVTVTANSGGSSGAIQWGPSDIRFIPPGNGTSNGDNLHITAPGDAEIVFDLDDRSGLNLRYRADKSDAIWIASGTQCPPAGPGDGGGEFEIRDRQNKKVTIFDRHSTRDEYCYALRFDSDAGLQTFDPIIKN